mgnify:CR=1 FL=1
MMSLSKIYKKIEILKNNWGALADSLACNAELRVYDPLSRWECFVFAINPEDEDEMACIINGFDVEVCHWRFSELWARYNAHGEAPTIDREFRPRNAGEIYKTLKAKHGW